MALPDIASSGLAQPLDLWRDEIVTRVQSGQRFAGLYGTDRDGACELIALLATDDGVDDLHTLITPDAGGVLRYASLSPQVPAAFWYERALHDLSGVIPDDHPRLDPLLLPLPEGGARPRPGLSATAPSVAPEERIGPVDVRGHGIFTLPFGPVRSGVMESIEYLIETPGEDIPHLNIRPHYKHRGIAKQFENRSIDDGVLVAERVEGISSVAHALAYCHAAENLAGVTVPEPAQLIRVVYAELERIVNHLDVTMRLCDAAGLAVATARFGWHKETLMRLVSELCGNRFGRGVIVPGGVSDSLRLAASTVVDRLATTTAAIESDLAALEKSASFLDRLRGTGPLTVERARQHGALGPIGRASGFDDDDRRRRGYDGYRHLAAPRPPRFDAGDAMARARVRWHEITTSAALVTAAASGLAEQADQGGTRLRCVLSVPNGYATGWAEAAQGEALYGLEVADGRIRRCFGRSASLHNLVLFHDVFTGDIFTDFPFIEASFGLSYAGVAM
jgi:Ni,Fe-hydrogenase III large subunit